MGKIIRKKSKVNFSVISKDLIIDNTLSWGATGLLCYLLTLPDDWNIYINDLKNRKTNGRDSTRNLISELIDQNYIIRKPNRNNNGQFSGYDYYVFEEKTYQLPQTENPISVNPFSDNPETENATIINTKDSLILNKNYYSNKDLPEKIKIAFNNYIQYMKAKKGKSWYNEKTIAELKNYIADSLKIFSEDQIIQEIKKIIRNGYFVLDFSKIEKTDNNIWDEFLNQKAI